MLPYSWVDAPSGADAFKIPLALSSFRFMFFITVLIISHRNPIQHTRAWLITGCIAYHFSLLKLSYVDRQEQLEIVLHNVILGIYP